MRYELTDDEWTAIRPMLPNKPRGVPRVNDRRVLNGIFWILRSGAPWRDLPDDFGPYTTCYNRFVRRRRAGVWRRIMDALATAHDASVQMIDTSIIRVHQHGACIVRNRKQSMGRSRGGLTSKIHALVDTKAVTMQVLPDAIIINASPSQREILRNPKYSGFVQGMTLAEKSSRPRIPVANIEGIIRRLRELQPVIADDPDYSDRRPKEVIDRIILRIEDAAKAQRRAYPKNSN